MNKKNNYFLVIDKITKRLGAVETGQCQYDIKNGVATFRYRNKTMQGEVITKGNFFYIALLN